MNRICLLGILLAASSSFAQREPGYDRVVVPQTRIDVRDLGYSPVDLIPDGESAITSLALAPNGDVYGATSGTHSHLFLLNPQHGYVFPLGIIQGERLISHGVVIAASGDVYMGGSPSGHLLEYTPHNVDQEDIQIGRALPSKDIGTAVQGESILALAIDRNANVIYGLTSPNAHLFCYSIADKSFEDLGVIAKAPPPGEKFEHENMISRMLIVDAEGDVFASGEDGYFYQYLARSHKLQKLLIHAPAVPGREPYTRVDAFVLDPGGLIYGGTSDGYLFRLDPKDLTIRNLGKPLNQYRIAGLARSTGGKLYGVGGDSSEMARMFSYDPSTGAYELLGFIDVNRRPYFAWQAYEIGDVISDSQGTIYLGEDERISKLYLFFPW
jgi:hypothetical protein